MSNDPYAGVNVSNFNQARGSEAQPYDELGSLVAQSAALQMAAGLVPDAGLMMPELFADATQPGAGSMALVDQFQQVNSAFTLEHQRALYELAAEQMGTDWEQQAEMWDRISPELRQAFEAEGMTRPSDPSPGGVDIPFTSILKRGWNALGGDAGDGNVELFSGTDNWATTAANESLNVLNAPAAVVREGGSQVFSALDWVSNNVVERPLRTGQAVREEVMGVNDYQLGDDSRITGFLGGITGTIGNAAFAFGGLFTGRSQELWAITEDRNGTFRPQAVSEALEIVDGDTDLHQLALSFSENRGDVLATVEAVSGEMPGTPRFNEIFTELLLQLDPEGPDQRLNEAIEIITNNKIGIGHDFAETLGLDQGTTGHAYVSAGYEMGVLMVVDPTLVGGKINRIRKGATFAVQSGQLSGELDRAFELADLARSIDRGDDALDAAAISERVIAANGHTVSRLRNSQWSRMVVRDSKQIEYGRSVDRVMQRIADAADASTDYTWHQLVQDVPATGYMRQELINAASKGLLEAPLVDGVRDTSRVWDFMRDSTGRRALISGATGRDPRAMALPRITGNADRWAGAKSWINRKIDLSTTMPADMRREIEPMFEALRDGTMEVEDFNIARSTFRDSRSIIQRAPANWLGLKPLINRAIKHTPRNGFIDIGLRETTPGAIRNANQGLQEFDRYVEFGDLVKMPDEVKAMYRETFANGNQGERFATVRQFTTEILLRSGAIEESDKAMELLRRYGLAMDQHFDVGAQVDDVRRATTETMQGHTAIWDKQIADRVAIPNFIELKAAIAKHNVLTAFGAGGIGYLDNILNRVWKPMVLVRPAFVARAAGEETSSMILRLGLTAYMRAQFGRRWAIGTTVDRVTGVIKPIRELNYSMRRVNTTARHIKSIARTLPNEMRTQAIARMSDVEQAHLRNVERLVAKGDVNPERLAAWADEIDELMAPAIEAYRAELPLRSRFLDSLADMAIAGAETASPVMYDALRALKIPSRADIGARIVGANVIGYTGSGRPILAEAPRLFGARQGAAGGSFIREFTDQVVGADLIEAERLANHNPVAARIAAREMGSTYDVYGIDQAARAVDESVLASSVQTRVEVRNSGRKVTIPMRPSNEWEWVDHLDLDARTAIGNAFHYPVTDPAVRDSGALDTLASFVGPNTLGELRGAVRVNGKFVNQDQMLAMLEDARHEVSAVTSMLGEGAADLRYALTNGEAIPASVYAEIPALKPFADVLDAGTNQANRIRGLIYPNVDMLDTPLSRNLDETIVNMQDQVWNFMQRADYQPELSALATIAQRRGKGIAQPLPVDQTRLYGVSIRAESINQLRSMATNPMMIDHLNDMVVASLKRNGVSEVDIETVMAWFLREGDGLDPNFLRLAGEVDGYGADADFVAGANVFFADPNVATEVSDAFDEVIQSMARLDSGSEDVVVPAMERAAEVGITDVPTSVLRDKFSAVNYDDDWRSSSVFALGKPDKAGIDVGVLGEMRRLPTEERVVFRETIDGKWVAEDVLDDMLPDDLPELTDRVQWASGFTEHSARRELAQARFDGLYNLFVTNEGEALTEVLGHLKGGTFDSKYHMLGIPPGDLPAQAYKPIMVDADTNMWNRMVSGFFSEVVDTAVTGMVRSPLVKHNLASTLPAAADWYHSVVQGPRNTRVLDMLNKAGIDDDDISRLLDEVHYLLRSPELADEPTEMAALIRALGDERVDADVGAEMFADAMAGNIDQRRIVAQRMAEDMEASARNRIGDEISTLDEASQSNLLARQLGVDFESVDELRALRRELREDITTMERIVQTPLDQLDESVDVIKVEDEIRSMRAQVDELGGRIDNLSDDVKVELTDAELAVRGKYDRIADALKRPIDKNDPEAGTMWDMLQGWSTDRYFRFQETAEQAMVRAIDMSVEFIDDHRFRSQFQQTVRNLMPFHFAEEQFIKRQIRMLVDSPESIRRASLLMNAARHSGLIQHDGDGNEIFVYPGTEFINSQLLQFSGVMTGMEGLEVYAQPMSAQVGFMLPGYSGEIVEGGTGPLVGFTTAFLIDRYPELDGLDRIINRNEVAQGKSPWEYFMPPVASRLFDVVGIEALGNDRMMSAQNRAIQMAIANGTAPSQDATASEKQEFLDRTREHARIINIMDTALYMGSPLPSGARVTVGDLELSEDFTTIVYESGLPYQEAMALFFEQYPDATPWTVFGTESATGAPLATTAEQFQYLDNYESILTDAPQAAAWLMPPIGGDDEYHRRAREEMFNLNLRDRRTPEEFLDEIYFSQAADPYYEVVNAFDLEIYQVEQAGGDPTVLEEQRKIFHDAYLNMHPVFAENMGRNRGRREQAKTDRDYILSLDREELPDTQHATDMLTLMAAHQQFNRSIESLANQDGADVQEQRDLYRRQWLLWSADFVSTHPQTERYFTSNIRWDSDITNASDDLIFEIEAILGREL